MQRLGRPSGGRGGVRFRVKGWVRSSVCSEHFGTFVQHQFLRSRSQVLRAEQLEVLSNLGRCRYQDSRSHKRSGCQRALYPRNSKAICNVGCPLQDTAQHIMKHFEETSRFPGPDIALQRRRALFGLNRVKGTRVPLFITRATDGDAPLQAGAARRHASARLREEDDAP